MATLDTLEILIEADARGLETQLKKAGANIVSFIDKMNSQEVNWESILAGSLNTAVIAGIASTFALAIEQTVQFQNATLNMNNIATPATKAFADSINTVGGQAYQLAQSSGQSLGDAASAFELFSKNGLDAATATYAVNEASNIAFSTGESFMTVVQQLSELFKNWGVTTIPQVQKSLDGLGNAVQNGQFTWDELIKAITPQGAFLQTKTNIADVAVSLSEMSNVSGVTKDTVVSTFNAIAAGVKNKTADINLLVGDMSKFISSGPTGMITAFQAIKDKLDQYGPAISTTIGTSMGLSKQDVAQFSNTTDTEFKRVSDAADYLLKHLTPIDKITADNTSEASKMQKAWNQLVDTFDSFVVPPAIDALTAIFDGANDVLQKLITGVKSLGQVDLSNFNPLIGITKGVSSVVGATGAGNLVSSIANGQVGNDLASLGNSIASTIGNFLSGIMNNNNSSAQNQPKQNSTAVNLHVTNNVSGAGGNASAIGGHIATQLYNLQQGTQ